MSQRERAVTVAVSRRVVSGREQEFAEWAKGVIAVACQFPGFLGAGYIRPATPAGAHTIVYRFDTPDHFETWQDSSERSEWLERLSGVAEPEPSMETATGLEYWFRDPSSPGAPVVWKQVLVTMIGLYPAGLLIAYALTWIAPHAVIPLRVLATTLLTVPLLTFVVMPALTKLFGRWLRR